MTDNDLRGREPAGPSKSRRECAAKRVPLYCSASGLRGAETGREPLGPLKTSGAGLAPAAECVVREAALVAMLPRRVFSAWRTWDMVVGCRRLRGE